jgi:hypothetical protein
MMDALSSKRPESFPSPPNSREQPTVRWRPDNRVDVNTIRLDPIDRPLHLTKFVSAIVNPFAEENLQPNLSSIDFSKFNQPLDYFLH